MLLVNIAYTGTVPRYIVVFLIPRLGADGEYLRSLLAQSSRRPGCDLWSLRSLQPFSVFWISSLRCEDPGRDSAGGRKTRAAQIDEHREQIGGQIVTCPVLTPAWP